MGNILALKKLTFWEAPTKLNHFTRVKLGRPPAGGGVGGSSSVGLRSDDEGSTELSVLRGVGAWVLLGDSALACALVTGMGNAMP